MNDEIRMTNDESNPKVRVTNVRNIPRHPRFRHSSFDHSNFIRHSSFEFRHSRRAFTLIEVLAAIGVIAMVLPVAMYGLSVASDAATLARHRTQATVLAQTKLDELLATQDFTDLSGDFGDDYPDYKWTIEFNNWDTPDGNFSSNTQQLDVIVSWTQRNRTHEATLSTLLYESSTSSDDGGLLQ